MKKIKSEKGVTLMALVITIIILLILASVTISSLKNEDSLISSTEEERNKVLQTQAKQTIEVEIEKVKLNNVSNKEMNKTKFMEELQNNLQKYDSNAKVKDNSTEENMYDVEYNGYTFNYYYND